MIKTIEAMPALFILTTIELAILVQALLKFCLGQSLLKLYILDGIIAYWLSTVLYIVFLRKFNLAMA